MMYRNAIYHLYKTSLHKHQRPISIYNKKSFIFRFWRFSILQYFYLELSNCSEIWQAPQQLCCYNHDNISLLCITKHDTNGLIIFAILQHKTFSFYSSITNVKFFLHPKMYFQNTKDIDCHGLSFMIKWYYCLYIYKVAQYGQLNHPSHMTCSSTE